MSNVVKCANSLLNKGLKLAEFLNPISLMFVRIWVAGVFWLSGLSKITNWDSTLFLFEHEYQVPFLPVSLAAFLGTFVELVMPVLLVAGFASRLAALALLGATLMIQFVYPNSFHEHVVWAVLLLVIILQGPGRFSWDFILRHHIRKDTGDVGSFSYILSVAAAVLLSLFMLHEIGAALEMWEPLWLTWSQSLAAFFGAEI